MCRHIILLVHLLFYFASNLEHHMFEIFNIVSQLTEVNGFGLLFPVSPRFLVPGTYYVSTKYLLESFDFSPAVHVSALL